MDLHKSPSTPDPSFAHKPPSPRTRRRRRCLCGVALCCVSTLVILAVVILVLALTVFRRRDPIITVTSIVIQGVSPSITFPLTPSSFQLNLTLLIGARVYNPNRASFTHAPGTVLIFYRSAQVGDADVGEGRIPSRGTEDVNANVTLTLQSFVQVNVTTELIRDVLGGEVGMDTKARIPGRVTFLGFIKKHLVAISECHFVVGFPSLDVKRQDCSSVAKL